MEKIVLFVKKGGLSPAEPFLLSSLPSSLPPTNIYKVSLTYPPTHPLIQFTHPPTHPTFPYSLWT